MRAIRVSSRITPELKAALEKRAELVARSESQVIELALQSYLSKREEKK